MKQDGKGTGGNGLKAVCPGNPPSRNGKFLQNKYEFGNRRGWGTEVRCLFH